MTMDTHIHNDDSSSEGQIPDVISGVLFNQEQPQAAPIVDFPDDDGSGEIREYTGVFEGPEKTLEVCFRQKDKDVPPVVKPGERAGLRKLSQYHLSRICARARCTILSRVSNSSSRIVIWQSKTVSPISRRSPSWSLPPLEGSPLTKHPLRLLRSEKLSSPVFSSK